MWHLVAWRFISAVDRPLLTTSRGGYSVDYDIAAACEAAAAADAADNFVRHAGGDAKDDAPAAAAADADADAKDANLARWRMLSEMDTVSYECVEPALDSFRTLYCPRCHIYDCNLHGCGQDQPRVKLEPAPQQSTGMARV